MNITDFREMYLKELQEARSFESQLVEALPKMKEKATDDDLKKVIGAHLEETRSQLDQVEAILKRHGADGNKHTDQAMQSIIGEAEKWAGMIGDAALRDAGIIASAQRVEHYEIAVYGTLASWAKQLGHDEDLNALLAILDQEKAADGKLSELARREINPEAAR